VTLVGAVVGVQVGAVVVVGLIALAGLTFVVAGLAGAAVVGFVA